MTSVRAEEWNWRFSKLARSLRSISTPIAFLDSGLFKVNTAIPENIVCSNEVRQKVIARCSSHNRKPKESFWIFSSSHCIALRNDIVIYQSPSWGGRQVLNNSRHEAL